MWKLNLDFINFLRPRFRNKNCLIQDVVNRENAVKVLLAITVVGTQWDGPLYSTEEKAYNIV